MPDFGAWMNWNATGDLEAWLSQAERADSVTFMINHRGVNVTLVRGATTLDAQKMLLVPAGRNTTASVQRGETGDAAREQLLLVGIPTVNIRKGDRFMYPSTAGRLNYEVQRVEQALHGMIQAFAEEMQ